MAERTYHRKERFSSISSSPALVPHHGHPQRRCAAIGCFGHTGRSGRPSQEIHGQKVAGPQPPGVQQIHAPKTTCSDAQSLRRALIASILPDQVKRVRKKYTPA